MKSELPQLGDRVTVEVQDLSRGGAGLARLESGAVVFVPFTAPGDVAEVEIIRVEKRYVHARVLKLQKASSLRVEPRCAVFGVCGGCDWQHLPYEVQWERKVSGVLHALKRAGVGHEEPPLDAHPSREPWNYRNRIQLRGAGGKIGFYMRGSNEVVEVERCEIAKEALNARLQSRASEQLPPEPFKWEMTLSTDGQTVLDSWNRPHAALGFRQVNDAMNAELQAWVVSQAGRGEHLVDLFGGSGNLSRPLQDAFSKIDCVDVRVPAESPASHFRFWKGDALWWLRDHVRDFSDLKCRVVLVDPPREGVGRRMPLLARAFEQIQVDRLIAVGCDPDAFARDVKGYLSQGFHLERLAVFDLFPQTHHVEAAASFTKK